ncbi:B9 domain-containing protein 1 [Tyrophagus putrescentiae]|nr:B9 domain-containing protein 1 [Tyrophagus putrescentiae]
MAPPFGHKGRKGHPGTRQDNSRSKGSGDFDLEKARHEVFMLGIKGFKHKDKLEAKKELAIRLGAIPKKPRGVNIKKHLENVRERKQKEAQEREERAQMGQLEMRKGKWSASKNDSRKKKGLNEVRQMDYQIGRFKDGVQYLNKEDIGRLKRRK